MCEDSPDCVFQVMEVGLVKIAEDSDFRKLKTLVDDNTNWKLEYNKNDETKVFIIYKGY